MKQLFNIESNLSFYLLLAFIFMINFSIAGCYLLFTLLLLQAIISYCNTRRFPELPKYYKYFLLYILFTLISSIFGLNPLVSLKHDKEFFIYLLIPLYLMVINSKKRLDYSLITILISTTLSALVGLADVLKRGASLDFRLKGFLSHWMTYSGLLMLTFIFFAVYFFYEKCKKRKIIIAIFLAIILPTIYYTLTRSIWIGVIVSLGIFIIYSKPKILFIAAPLIIIIAFLMPASVKSRIVSIADMNNASNKDRVIMTSIAFKIFKDYPLTGVGPNNIPIVYDRYKPPQAEQSNMHLHSNFLHALAERGIFALLSLIAAFISIIYQLIKKIKNTSGVAKVVSLSVLFAFIGFIVTGLFEYNYGDSEVRFLLYFLITIPFIPGIENWVGEPS